MEGRRLLTADLLARFEFTNVVGETQSSLQVGQDYQLKLYVQDNRDTPQGVFQAYFDVEYDASLLSTIGAISFGPAFSATGLTFGDTSTNGLIDDAGGRDTDQLRPTPRDAELLLFSVPFHADAAGTLALDLGLADRPERSIQFFDTVSSLPIERVDFSGGEIEIIEAGILVTPTAELTTSETGDSDTFQVVLTSQPGASVTIGLTSSDATEGTVSPASLVFNSTDWDTPQTVTVSGVDDFAIDGPVSYSIVTSPAVSADPRFDGLDPDDVSVTNSNNDVAGLSITETNGLTEVSEDGTSDSFTVALTSQPSTSVMITLANSDSSETSLDPSSLTFTPANWNVAQTVTVTGVDDALIDGNQITTVTLSVEELLSDDDFDLLPDRTVTVTTVDNGDAAGFEVAESFDSTVVSESGTADLIRVRLTAQPDSDVLLLVSGSDPGEATLDVATLTFTPSDWNIQQTVRVTGVDDYLIDGNQTSSITFAVDDANSDDHFDSLANQIVMVTTTDDGDAAGVDVSESGNATIVSESGTSDTIQVTLTAQPDTEVTLLVTASDASEVAIDRTALTFTSANWDTPQTITVTGRDDDLVDGSVVSTVTLSIDDEDSDDQFDSLADQTVAVTTTDDDTAGFIVTETGGETAVSESGTSDTIDVVLTAKPDTDVVLQIAVSDPSEATVDTTSLVFTPESWDAPQTVTVTGIDDFLIDHDQISMLTLGVDDLQSDDNFDSVGEQSVPVTTLDDGDLADVTITETDGVTEVSEAGTSDTLTVALTAQPDSTVVLTVIADDPSEISVDLGTLTFRPDNWNVPQTVTVTGVDDNLLDGDLTSTMTFHVDDANSDDNFDLMVDRVINVTTTDNGDTAGFTATPLDIPLQVSETGASDTFEVVLTAQPDSNVVLAVLVSDASEAALDKAVLTFTPGNWNVSQTVTVSGVDDFLLDGDQDSVVTVAVDQANSDDNFDSAVEQSLAVVTADDGDAAGFVVTETGDGTAVSESGTIDTFDVVLMAQPVDDVVIDVVISDPSEVAVNASSLIFDPDNWDVPQTVTVTGVDDFLIDGDIESPITLAVDVAASDDDFDLLSNQTVFVTTADDGDAAGFTVTETGGETAVSESGPPDTFSLVLTAQPDGNVVILVTGSDGSEVDLDTPSVLFTPSTWDTPQIVTVTGVDDDLIDGDVITSISLAIDDANSDDHFDGVADQSVLVTTYDDGDVAGLIVTETANTTQVSESGTTDTVEVALTAKPDSTVVVLVSSSDTSEATIDKPTLTFQPATWNVPQTITIAGVDDLEMDGDQVTHIRLSIDDANSDDHFDVLDDRNVAVTTVDDDTPGILVTPLSGLTTDESGREAVFQIVLKQRPEADVSMGLNSENPSEATVSPTSVTFTSDDWNTPQLITVTGVNDFLIDGSTAYTIVIEPATSTDLDYDGLNPDDVSGVNEDDDVADIVVVQSDGETEVSESGTSDTFDVTLAAQPASDVVISVVSNDPDEATVDPPLLTFTPENWNIPQIVTVTGVDDALIDGTQQVAVDLSVVVENSDDDFDSVATRIVEVTTTDFGDAAGIQVAHTDGATIVSETGTTDSFDVVLTAQPVGQVVVDLSIGLSDELSLDQSSLTFAPDSWNIPRTVTVTGLDDAKIDGPQITTITLSVRLPSGDADFDGAAPQTLVVTTTDAGDVAGLAVVETEGSTEVSESGTTDSFDVVLIAQPDSDVVISVGRADEGEADEATVSPTTLTFTPENWHLPQTVTVTGMDDPLIDGPQSTAFVLSIVDVDSDDHFDDLPDETVTVTTTDFGDEAGIAVIETDNATGVSETGTTDEIRVQLTAQPDTDVVIAVSMGDASEVVADAATLTFSPDNWDVPQIITLTGVDDSIVDGDKASSLVLSIVPAESDDHFDAVSDQSVSVTTADDDLGELRIAARETPQDEGDAGTTTTYQFDVTLSGNIEGAFSVAYTTEDGTATTADGDYVTNSGTLDFVGSDSEIKTGSVVVNGDGTVEMDETFTMRLGALSNVPDAIMDRIVIVAASATATIRDDDTADLTIADVTQAEGTETSTGFVFAVTLSDAVQGGFDVAYETNDGTATAADSDFVGTSGTLSFQGHAGEVQTISVSVNGDSHVERTEQFTLTLGDLSQLIDPSLIDRITVSDDSARGQIDNDDTATIAFIQPSSNVIEASGTHSVDVVLNLADGATLAEDVVVVVEAVGGTAQSPADFALENSSVTFEAGSVDGTTRSFEIAVVLDNVAEQDDETVELQLAVSGDGIGGAVSAGTADTHEITITDDSRDASLSGFVWADLDNDGQRDWESAGSGPEVGVPGVRVTLTGTTREGESLELVAMTGPDGAYRFYNLPAGTYELRQDHPMAFVDGQDRTSADGAQVEDDHVSGIVILPGQALTENVFYERGLHAEYVSIRLLLASTPPGGEVLRQWNIQAAEINGQTDLAQGIEDGTPPADVSPLNSAPDSAGAGAAAGAEGEGSPINDVSTGESEGPTQPVVPHDHEDVWQSTAVSANHPRGASEASSAWSARRITAFDSTTGDVAPSAQTQASPETDSSTSEDLPPDSDKEVFTDALFSNEQEWLDSLGLP